MTFAPELFRSFAFLVSVLIPVVCMCVASPVCAENSPEEIAKQMLSSVMTSASGRFIVVGTNSVENVYIAHWAEKKTDKIEDVLGIKMPFENRVLRIIIRATTGDVGKEKQAWVTVSQGILNGRFEQRLVIYNYDNERRDVALCQLLLNGYIRKWDFREWPVAGVEEYTTSYSLRQVPLWLAHGINENMDAGRRAENSSDVVARWMDGKLPGLSSVILPGDQYKGFAEPIDKALCGVFTSWLLSVPGSRVLFGDMFSRLADGKDITLDWLAEKMPDCGSRTKMIEAWDWWLNAEKRRIYKLGTTPIGLVKDLQSELLIYPADSGISMKAGIPKAMSPADLLELSGEDWVRKAARSKSISLKLISAGRGESFIEVIDLYCEFFDMLANGAKEKELKVALEMAETARKALSAKSPDQVGGK